MIEERSFNNRYRLDAKLGEGGMATVYSGTDTVLRRRVAIKVLRPQYAADAEFVRRFYQEAESAARLSHPNIVNTYDVGREDDTYFIVMELVDGSSLAEIIAADGRLPEAVALDYATQVASGLAYAHRTGLLHRDIKPANILVTKDDVVKLSDFGIARAVSEHTMALTKPGLVMGSVYYVSPEQALGHELHETSDLYSLGVVLYQMLTGTLPYSGESPVTVALKHVGDPVPQIDARALSVSPALAAIVNRLLQKEPGHRFASASDLATALREARERPAVARSRIVDDAPAARASRSLPPRRSPLPDYSSADAAPSRNWWPAVALIAVLLIATGAGYYLFGRPLPAFTHSIPVGNYTGMVDAQAQQAAVNDGLRVRVVRSPSDTVAVNHVIRQNPPAGAGVAKNSLVELIVSNGKPMVGLADVRGYSANDAQRTLQGLGFAVTLIHKHDSSPNGNVIDQTPVAGAKVTQGTRVSLLVSDGPAPVAVPNVVGMSVNDARVAVAKLGLSFTLSQQAVTGVPADTIASQNPPAGTPSQRGGAVSAVASTGVQSVPPVPQVASAVAVPGVVGQHYQDAIAAVTGAGFRAAVQFAVAPGGSGTVVAEDPVPSTQLPVGSAVTLTLSVSGEVPDTEGMAVDRARATLSDYGYTVGQVQYTTALGAGGRVVGTNPAVGTALRPGSSVALIVNGTPPQ